jgi:hypothetical protein
MVDRPDPGRETEPHASELAQTREEAAVDERFRAAYRQPSAADEPARERLLARLAGERTAPRTGGFRWWFAVRAYHARPAWVLATLVAVLAAGAWLGARFVTARSRHGVTPLVLERGPAGANTLPVTFVLRAPGASRVSVVGDFNNWDASATPMAHSGSGDLWVLNVQLPRGVHLYSFVLDGSEWRPDPSAPLAADGSFGGHNSVIVVDGAGL